MTHECIKRRAAAVSSNAAVYWGWGVDMRLLDRSAAQDKEPEECPQYGDRHRLQERLTPASPFKTRGGFDFDENPQGTTCTSARIMLTVKPQEDNVLQWFFCQHTIYNFCQGATRINGTADMLLSCLFRSMKSRLLVKGQTSLLFLSLTH